MARCVRLSPYNEAERVNAAETESVSKLDVPDLHALGLPRTSAELLRNRRSFAKAIANCIGSVTYAGKKIPSMTSFPGDPHSEDISDAERTAARSIMSLKSEEKKRRAPMATTVLPTLKYKELHGFQTHYSFQLRRNACRLPTRLGRLCCRRDYAPDDTSMPFLPCAERAFVGPEPEWFFIPMPPWKDDKYAHWDTVLAGLIDGSISHEYKLDPPSLVLKAFYKGKSKNPPADTRAQLARDLLHSDDAERLGIVNAYFDEKRNNEFIVELEHREKANQVGNRIPGEDEIEPVVLKILGACASKVAGIRANARSTKLRCVALLDDDRVGLSPRGSEHELLERIFDNREHIVSIFDLTRDQVFGPPSPDEDDFPCQVCGERSEDMDNVIVQCESAEHDAPSGIHQRCMTPAIDYIPVGEWLCPQCTDKGLWVMTGVHGKKVENNGLLCYLCSWNNNPEVKEWNLWSGFPPGARTLAHEFNRRVAREHAEATCGHCEAALGEHGRVTCSGDHDEALQFHLACVGLGGTEPVGDWICSECIAGGNKCPQLVDEKGRVPVSGHVTYRVKMWGSDERVWLRPRDFPTRRSARLVKAFSESQRERETKTKASAAERRGPSHLA